MEKDAEMNDYTIDGQNIIDKQIILHLEQIVHHCSNIQSTGLILGSLDN